MQHVAGRYGRDANVGGMNQADVRGLFLAASQQAHLPISDARRGVVLGPPLPAGATSEDERVLLELTAPREPGDIRERISRYLPDGVALESVWIALPGHVDENPACLDEAVYDIRWPDAPPADELSTRLGAFLAASQLPFTRIREKKIQQMNARALVSDLRLLERRDDQVCMRMTLAVGPRGSLRPEEVLQVLGYAPAREALGVHRVAVQLSAWRRPACPTGAARWRRPNSF